MSRRTGPVSRPAGQRPRPASARRQTRVGETPDRPATHLERAPRCPPSVRPSRAPVLPVRPSPSRPSRPARGARLVPPGPSRPAQVASWTSEMTLVVGYTRRARQLGSMGKWLAVQ